jgi:Winged helix DNA-binding domain
VFGGRGGEPGDRLGGGVAAGRTVSASGEASLVEIVQRRMHSVGLWGGPIESPAEVVHRLGAVQSQDYGPAKWSIASRTTGHDDRTLEGLFDEGALLRTHVLRPTWHFVLERDIRWLLELTGPRVDAGNAFMYNRLELAPATRSRCHGLIARWLEEDGELTRGEIGARLGREGIVATGQRLGYVMMSAELAGVVCSGSRHGKQHTYALLERRAPGAIRLAPDDALAELTRRYFTGHGPATMKDFRWWSSLTMADIRRGVEMAGHDLRRTEAGGATFWGPDGPAPAVPSGRTVHLLQPYDEYVVGYAETKRLLRLDAAEWDPTARPTFNGVLLVDGQVSGEWRRTVRRDSVAVEVRLREALDVPLDAALRSAVDGHGRFHDRVATLTLHQ